MVDGCLEPCKMREVVPDLLDKTNQSTSKLDEIEKQIQRLDEALNGPNLTKSAGEVTKGDRELGSVEILERKTKALLEQLKGTEKWLRQTADTLLGVS